ncbi:hypothetical protein, conserved [Plasmodium vivax]|nr:hypothetical protein, conserved [Plasmodium vivax]
MSYPCKENFKGYLSYKCYDNIKEQFVEKLKRPYPINDQILKFVQDYNVDKLRKLNEFSDVFTNLQKYLSNGHVFVLWDNYNPEGTCDYISYLLYEGILKIKSEFDKNTFDYFKEFVDSYNNSTNSHMCNDKLKHLDYEDFLKRKALYTLYDWYYKVDYLKNMPHRPKICEIVQSLIYYYNQFNKSFYEKDEELLEKLKNLKTLIEKHTWVSELNCETSLSNLRSLRSVYLENKKKQEIERLESTLTTLPNHPPSIKLERDDETISTPVEGEPQGLHAREEQHKGRGHESKVSELDEMEGTKTRRGGVPAHVIGPTRTSRDEITIPERKIYQYSYDRADSDYTEPVDGHEIDLGRNYRNPRVDPQITPNDQEGVLESMRNTFSSIVQNVDPVPVVGVSGGMGALFLLFRYTPVGAFFRGGRGRAHRIPRSFNGQFLGGFTGYEEYDVGHILYGPMNPLAE